MSPARRLALAGASPLCAGLAALLAGALVFAAYGADPLAAYAAMARSALGSGPALAECLVKATPLLLTGLAVALPGAMRLWNVGAEGQFACGALGATWSALFLTPSLPGFAALPAALCCGALCGAAWAALAGLLKARLGVSEILSTLLLNYVALILMEQLFYGPWRDPFGLGFPGTAIFPAAAHSPRLPGTRIHLGLVLGVGAAAGLALALRRSAFGYRVRVLGSSERAAHYADFSRSRHILALMALAGALAGLAGAGEVTGVHHKLQEGVAVGLGFDGIIVACLARLSPAWVPAAALLLGAVLVAGEGLQGALALPASVSQVLMAALLLGLLAADRLLAPLLGPLRGEDPHAR